MSTQITKFDRKACATVEQGAMEALAAYAKTLGLVVEREGAGMFGRDGSFFQFKVKFTAGGEAGVEEAKRKSFALNATIYGLDEKHFGQVFKAGSRTVKVVGFNTRSRKYPIMCVDVNSGQDVSFPSYITHAIINAYNTANS